MKKMSEVTWVIHYVRNNATCEACGKKEEVFLPYICDAHTHGIDRYNHLEFQVVLDVGPELIGYILNSMGRRVQAGKRFKDGDIITGITSDRESNDLPLRLKEVTANGERVLRIILPDENNLFPDDADCQNPYNLQHQPEEMLKKLSKNEM